MLKVAQYIFEWLHLLLCALENKLLNLATKLLRQHCRLLMHFSIFSVKVTIHSPLPGPTAKAAVILDFEHTKLFRMPQCVPVCTRVTQWVLSSHQILQVPSGQENIGFSVCLPTRLTHLTQWVLNYPQMLQVPPGQKNIGFSVRLLTRLTCLML